MLKQRHNSYKVKNIVTGLSGQPLEAIGYRKSDSLDNSQFQSITDNNETPTIKNEAKFVPKLYTRRWLYLVIAVIINTSDGASWINFASITNVSAAYFKVSINSINFLSMIFFIVYIPLIFVAMLIVNRFGLSHAFYWACGTNLVGSVVRLFGTFDFVPEAQRFPILLAGQTILSLTQPFCMCMPTQLSQDWFPENERTIATTIVSLSNLAGSMIASFISPVIAVNPEDVTTLNIAICGYGIFAGAIGIFVRESRPEFPPNLSAAEARNKPKPTIKSYLIDLKKLLIDKQFLLLTLTAAATGVGLVYTLLTILQQMLCSFNYSNSFSGICTALMIAGGIVGSPLFTKVADKTKKLEEIVAVSFSISVLIDIALILISNIRDLTVPIVILSIILGVINLGVYPVCLEVAADMTYPIDQSLSAGLIACWQQVQGAAFVPLVTVIAVPLNSYQMQYQTCTVGSITDAFDMTNGALCLVGLITLFDILLLVFFRPIFKRTELENVKKQQSLQLANAAFSTSNNPLGSLSQYGSIIPPLTENNKQLIERF